MGSLAGMARRSGVPPAAILLLLLLLLTPSAEAQLSDPAMVAAMTSRSGANKFLQRNATNDITAADATAPEE